MLLRREPELVASSLTVIADLAATAAPGGPGAALDLARTLTPRLPLPGAGATTELWQTLATLGAVDLSVARAVEPHQDALSILAEAGLPAPPPETTWAVYAAEGPGVRLSATRSGDDGWLLRGTKAWCSLADRVSHALVTGWIDQTSRGLFAVDLRDDGVRREDVAWHARGLSDIRSGPVTFTAAPATAVGEPEWYLRRSGFAWGGMGVAAIWYGGAVAVARRMLRQVRERELDQIGRMHLGAVDTALSSARLVLADAARLVDAGQAAGQDGALLALRVRQVVADCVECVLTRADHALGPAPLAFEADHAQRVADLRLYVRQHHAERDAAALGGRIAESTTDGEEPW